MKLTCPRCGKDLTESFKLMGHEAAFMHRYAHLRDDAGMLKLALEELIARCDGEEGIRADGSNISTLDARMLLESLNPPEKPSD